MLNAALFLKINNLAGQNIWLDRLAIFFSGYAGYFLLAALIFVWFFGRTKINRIMVTAALISAAVSRGMITTIIRFFYHSPRPFEVLKVHQLIPENDYSFPSGHAAFYFALSMAVYLYNKKLGIAFFAVSALMGLARIYAGVHWPADILGGLLVGVVSALAINVAIRRIFSKLKPSG